VEPSRRETRNAFRTDPSFFESAMREVRSQGHLPWCLFEAKLQDEAIARHHLDQARVLGGVPVVQVVHQEGVYKKQTPDALRCSASRLFC
jgi:hypothetical protein